MLNIAIVEDDPETAASMCAAIEAEPDMETTGVAATLAEGRALLVEPFDAALIDLGLGADSGLDLIAETRTRTDAAILVVSIFGDERNVVSAIEAGADGYALKGDSRFSLGAAIRSALAGEAPISPAVARHLLKRFRGPAPQPDVSLSRRELQVLEALALGHSYKEVARTYDISFSTVNTYVKALYKKLRVNSKGAAVRKALETGVIRIGDDVA